MGNNFALMSTLYDLIIDRELKNVVPLSFRVFYHGTKKTCVNSKVSQSI